MNKPHDPKRVLGKGLSALLPGRTLAPSEAPPANTPLPSGLSELPLESILPNAGQPRTTFHPEKLFELSESIKANGILQPILVRRRGDQYEIVAGERRWRAAKMAGLETAPAVIQDIADDNVLAIALIENIQRDDLNAIETAIAFDRLHRELNLTHEEIGRRTGKDRSSISNFMRLLKLPADVQQLVSEGRLSMGHARAILGLPTEELQRAATDKVLGQGLSVRNTERLVVSMLQPRDPKPDKEVKIDANVAAAEEQLQRTLGTRVRIVAKNEKAGRIEIDYYSQEELDRLYNHIVGEN
jgi:ParB family transcriptional regulator, chromosome partitioning protein